MSRRSSEIHRLQSKILIRTNYFMQPCRKDTLWKTIMVWFM